jgi:hypothetical protein
LGDVGLVDVGGTYVGLRGVVIAPDTPEYVRRHMHEMAGARHEIGQRVCMGLGNPDLQITGILPTLSRTGTLLAREVMEEIEKHFGDRVFKSRIRSNVRLAEAPSHGKSIFAYDERSAGAADYAALAAEVEAMKVPHRRIVKAEPIVDIKAVLTRLQPQSPPASTPASPATGS